MVFGTKTITLRGHSYRMWNLGFCWRGIHRRRNWPEWWAWSRTCDCGVELVPEDRERLDAVADWKNRVRPPNSPFIVPFSHANAYPTLTTYTSGDYPLVQVEGVTE